MRDRATVQVTSLRLTENIRPAAGDICLGAPLTESNSYRIDYSGILRANQK